MKLFVKVIPVEPGTGQTAGDGDLIPCPPDVEADTILSFLIQTYGPLLDTAWTTTPRHQRLDTGWIFAGSSAAGPSEPVELLCVPFFEADDGSLNSLFESLADQRQEFDELAAAGHLDENIVVTLPARDYQPTSSTESTRVETDPGSPPQSLAEILWGAIPDLLANPKALVFDHGFLPVAFRELTLNQLALELSPVLEAAHALATRVLLIMAPAAQPRRYVQVIAYEDGALLAEVSSNHYLESTDQLSPRDEALLVDLGWEAPVDGGDHLNWQRAEATAIPDIREVAERLTATLRRAFQLAGDATIAITAGLALSSSGTPLTPDLAAESMPEVKGPPPPGKRFSVRIPKGYFDLSPEDQTEASLKMAADAQRQMGIKPKV